MSCATSAAKAMAVTGDPIIGVVIGIITAVAVATRIRLQGVGLVWHTDTVRSVT
ncbi:MAG: hypothetical protein HOB98_06880 [Gammaproteobacteria bacterium]|nr:hypothetical protein [Gammaproteobacteria bacterium]MBT3867720.1 hypothetical protein [Gammaproteobacteria bacterium]MBT4381320.1 hypothetical protein [Gammaproteobacteria bacterium]MBT4616152.1 hypothetical protein [Gammaproteobacteria bacterium]MBT5196391.1 hypothetical protein [Gammaproteobacteria bacterium]